MFEVSSRTQTLQRSRLLRALRSGRRYDIVIIGGGASGLGCAVDAAARGHSVVLLEGHDFCKGTSSRATKLIHGGVRYLAQGNVPLVREALLERSRLLANAPHLVHPLRFVVPTYRRRDALFIGMGLTAYDLLAGTHGIEHCRTLDRKETLAALPTVSAERLRGGIAYWDAQFDDARLGISLMRTAFDLGAIALNYVVVEALLRDGGRVRGVIARDVETGEVLHVGARAVINATGVWADGVRRLERPDAAALLRPSQGVHVVVDRKFLPGRDALLVPRTVDGRVLFAIPWQGRVVIGTTDTARADAPLEPRPLAGEVHFILATAARHLDRAPGREDVRSVFAGLRPLIDAKPRTGTRRLSREHLVEVSEGGLVTITGGKWTTYRRMGEDAVDAAEAACGLPAGRCVTGELRLHGAPAPVVSIGGHPRREAGRVDDAYGSDRAAVDALPGAGQVLQPGLTLTEAEVRHAARHELARTVEDVLARRHRALFLDARLALAAAPSVARILAEELRRDAWWCEAEVQRFAALAAQYSDPGPLRP